MKTLLRIISRLGEKRAKDDQPHKGKRYLPFPTEEQFVENPTDALDQMAAACTAIVKAGKVSGVALPEGDEAGETVTDYKVVGKGPGKGLGNIVNRKVMYQWLKMGAKLANQQELQDSLVAKYGKAKADVTGEPSEDDTEVL